MGIFKQMKDMKDTLHEAPEMIEQAQQLAANAQAMAAAQQQAAQQAAATAAAPTGPDFEPINGVSLELYAEISKDLAAVNYDQTAAPGIAASKGVAPADWQAAVDGWNARMTSNPGVAQRFNALYTGARLMGLFKDIKKLKEQADEMEATFDPAQQARDATAQMKQMNAQMASAAAALAAPPADAVDATGQVVSVGATAGMMNMDPILPIELLVQQPGMPPRPASVSLVVPMAQLARVQAGAMLPLRVSRSNPNAIAVDWTAPA